MSKIIYILLYHVSVSIVSWQSLHLKKTTALIFCRSKELCVSFLTFCQVLLVIMSKTEMYGIKFIINHALELICFDHRVSYNVKVSIAPSTSVTGSEMQSLDLLSCGEKLKFTQKAFKPL